MSGQVDALTIFGVHPLGANADNGRKLLSSVAPMRATWPAGIALGGGLGWRCDALANSRGALDRFDAAGIAIASATCGMTAVPPLKAGSGSRPWPAGSDG
jgi:hypothetical protein